MTNQEAQKYFNALYHSLIINSFTDVCTFLDEEYTKIDPVMKLRILDEEVQNNNNVRQNLQKLVRATKRYFEKSSSLPQEISNLVTDLKIENSDSTLELLTTSVIDISIINDGRQEIIINLLNTLEKEIDNERNNNNDLQL